MADFNDLYDILTSKENRGNYFTNVPTLRQFNQKMQDEDYKSKVNDIIKRDKLENEFYDEFDEVVDFKVDTDGRRIYSGGREVKYNYDRRKGIRYERDTYGKYLDNFAYKYIGGFVDITKKSLESAQEGEYTSEMIDVISMDKEKRGDMTKEEAAKFINLLQEQSEKEPSENIKNWAKTMDESNNKVYGFLKATMQNPAAAYEALVSSIAGQAIIQAAMESALPIAQVDAQTAARFETQNLSNRQQAAMLAAEQRAKFMGQDFDQAFQARVQNAARVSDVANRNFTAEQQVQLENSKIANTMNLNNLSNNQAVVMAEAAALAQLDTANLNNRQQASVNNAKNFLQMDMANLSNNQQTELFKAQQRVQSLFTDQSAQNAARQFNASSQNQVDQFFANLDTQASQFNATQSNAQSQFNAGQANTVGRFNAELNNQRDQFNANNQMVIAQSNAQWRRQIATADTAAINRANELNANAILDISKESYDNLWQYYADTMEWAWKSTENELERVNELAQAKLNADSNTDLLKFKEDAATSQGYASLIGTILTASSGSIVGKLSSKLPFL